MSSYIHPTAVVDEGAQIGEGTKVWHFSHVEGTARIGEKCSTVIGNGCKLQNNVSIYEGVTLGNGVFCGPSCVFTNDLTPRALFPKGHENFVPTPVEDGASIGANAPIVCGHRIGRCAMIGAGAVVTTDVPPHALMLGVPAKLRGVVCTCGELLHDQMTCPKCGRHFEPDGEGLREVK